MLSGGRKRDINNNIRNSAIDTKENRDRTMRLDGNNVDLEKENVELARTQIEYSYVIQEINSYFGKLKSVIKQ